MSPRLSLRTVVIVLLVGQTLVVGAVVGFLSFRHGDQSVDELAMELTDAVAHRIDGHIARVLEEPLLLNELNADALLAYDIDPLGPTEPMEQVFFRHLQHFPASLTYIGTERGDYIGARRTAPGEYTISLVNEGTEWKNTRYATTAEGARTDLILTSDTVYDPRQRPWYAPAIAADGPAWTDVYTDYTSGALGVTASRPFKDRGGALKGVLASDLILQDLGRYLADLDIGKNGITYLVSPEDGLLISTSTGTPVFTGPRGDVTRLRAVDSLDPLIAASARSLDAHHGDGVIRTELDGEEYFVGADPYTDHLGLEWTIVVVVPRSDFTAHIDANMRATVLTCLLAMLGAALVGGTLAGRLTRVLGAVSTEMAAVGQLRLEEPAREDTVLEEVAVIHDALGRMKRGLRSFQRYVPVDLVRQLLEARTEAVLGGEPKELTIVFSDIADFTTLTERTEPQRMVAHLGDYLERMNEAIEATSGVVCQYLGDGILAMWGAPVDQEDHALRACRGALAMARAANAMMVEDEARGLPRLYTRIGVNSGEVIVGNIGAPERFNYCAVGDAVNTASRIEGLNKVYETQVLIGQRTRELIGDALVTRVVDAVRVKGKRKPIRVYEIVGEPEEVDGAALAELEAHSQAFEAYQAREFTLARQRFEALSSPAARVLAERCASFEASPPPDDWDGTWVLRTK
ncbi:MAG: hypothetical protein EP330_19040 [Deltaproteobacteria bacterium]|nr:MAG: hypothetical protein EP330_19040 [Deltaproteobacteria bacterium]